MTDLVNTNELADYDTAINIIGGLRDCSIIFKAIESHLKNAESLQVLISERNELDLRTERSRIRVERAIKGTFLQFKNQDHKDLFQGIFQHNVSLPERELILFWQCSLNNRLFREISCRVFVKVYFSGRAILSKDDITAYLKEFLHQNKHLSLKWSEKTITTLSTKYLNLMTKLNFLVGVRKKSFRHLKVTSESLVLFLYFAKLYDPENSNILVNALLPLSFIEQEDVKVRLKKLSQKGLFDMNFDGAALNIELNHSYKGICDALYN
jgi:hypothetical protein